MCILATYDTDEHICQVVDAVPNSDQMVRLIIEKQAD